MHPNILQALRRWRAEQARIEGVESYRVLPNAVLDMVALHLPKNKEELLCIKGIKEAKCRKYGKVLIEIIREHCGEPVQETLLEFPVLKEEVSRDIEASASLEPLSVSQFLDGVNIELSGMAARIKGEVTSLDERERVVYFTLKDSEDESTLNCLIFRYQYEISGVRLAIGDEVIVEGVPEIYKPNGRFSLKAGVIEFAGEGALKKAYEALRTKCEAAGLFDPARKRPLPEFPEHIALITSEQGAAIGDFTMNLGPQGFKVHFYPTAVEGKKAVFEILEAIKYFNARPEKYDVLVIVRGGGSMESLQAFNNEALICAVADSKIPTLLGIGHEKDVPLATLAADVAVSTPTATARTLRLPWDEARGLVNHFRVQLPLLFREQLSHSENVLTQRSEYLLSYLRAFAQQVQGVEQALTERLLVLQGAIRESRLRLEEYSKLLRGAGLQMLEQIREGLKHASERLIQYDPKRVLKLGYSLVQKAGRILKDAADTRVGDTLTLSLYKGKLATRVEKIID